MGLARLLETPQERSDEEAQRSPRGKQAIRSEDQPFCMCSFYTKKRLELKLVLIALIF
ncbi:hypothetical protein GA0061087_100991 [Priestia flexa]|nr:hypothetical protein GA0061087_100991 [Priestia flexa]